jgi:PadR family transcriptional regulator AphA
MSLRFALLAMLSAGPKSGYDLTAVFDRTVGYVWHAPHSQIYPELRRMEAAEWVAAEEVPRGPRGTKRVYSITDTGIAELRREASEVVPIERERDVIRLRAAYLEWARPEAALSQFEAHIAHYTEWLGIWRAMISALARRDEPQLKLRLASRPPEDHDAIVAAKIFAYEGLIARAEMEIEWARRGIKLVRDHAFSLGTSHQPSTANEDLENLYG